jgi:hypothetical protein
MVSFNRKKKVSKKKADTSFSFGANVRRSKKRSGAGGGS